MMWYFLVSDAFTFGALLIVYATLRVSAGWTEGWSQANDVFKAFPGVDFLNGTPLAFVTLMTFLGHYWRHCIFSLSGFRMVCLNCTRRYDDGL